MSKTLATLSASALTILFSASALAVNPNSGQTASGQNLNIEITSPNNGATVDITDSNWRAQTFYISPLDDRECLVMKENVRDSSACSTDAASDGTGFSAAFWDIPESWMQPEFDDSAWPSAVTYSNDTVGVNNKPAYTNFTDVFDTQGADAMFIWTSNLVLDNLVLIRTTLE